MPGTTEKMKDLFNYYLKIFKCRTYQELYLKLDNYSRHHLGMECLPFSLSDLEEPDSTTYGNVWNIIHQCFKSLQGDDSHSRAIQLIALLKKNPPNVTFENPQKADKEYTLSEKRFMHHIFVHGLELPGSKHNLFGHIQYFSEFFFDIFVGNFTEYL